MEFETFLLKGNGFIKKRTIFVGIICITITQIYIKWCFFIWKDHLCVCVLCVCLCECAAVCFRHLKRVLSLMEQVQTVLSCLARVLGTIFSCNSRKCTQALSHLSSSAGDLLTTWLLKLRSQTQDMAVWGRRPKRVYSS